MRTKQTRAAPDAFIAGLRIRNSVWSLFIHKREEGGEMGTVTNTPAMAVKRAGKAVVQLVLAMGIGIAMATPVAAQDGTLRGTITDDTGAALPGATVSTSSPALLGTREAVTDGTGQYRLGNL